MRFMKIFAAFVLAFMIVSPVSAMTGKSGQPVYYLALGDSLAAGIISNGEYGFGYTDSIAIALTEEKLLEEYNDAFTIPGAKTTDFLNALDSNYEKVVDYDSGLSFKIVDEVKRADVITLSIGANDVLSAVKRNGDKLEYDLVNVTKAITDTASNLDKLLKEILKLNPKVDIFVMGIYNPFPHLTANTFELNYLVNQVDTQIKNVAEANKMYFVPVKDAIAKNTAEYIPNPNNIHPSEAGYQAIADEFIDPMIDYIRLVPLPEIIDDESLPTFKDIKTSETAEYAGKAAKYGIMKGYPDGTFKPNGELTRVQVTSMIVRMLGLTETAKVPYTDTSKLAPATQEEIAKAYAAGLIPNAKTFKPSEPISRVEVAKMIADAYAYEMGRPYLPDDIAPFTDISKLTKEQKQNVTLLYDFGIAKGSNGKFMPTSTLKRSQAAKMFVEFYEKLN